MNKYFSLARKNALIYYLLIDYVCTLIAWICFWLYRKQWLFNANPEWEKGIEMWAPRDFLIGLIVVPGIMIFMHYLTGAYYDPYRKSRIQEIYRTGVAAFFGCAFIGVTAIANDWLSFDYFIKITSLYFIGQFLINVAGRMLLLNNIKYQLIKKHFGYNTIIIGGNGKSEKAYNELISSSSSYLYNIKGFVSVDDNVPDSPNIPLIKLGNKQDLEKIIDSYQIQEVVIALESHEHTKLQSLLVALSYRKLYIKVLPDTYDILSGMVKTSNVFDPIFVNIQPQLLSEWQQVLKRVIDIIASSLAIICLIPLYILSTILVKMTSKGPVFYMQERIGLFGKPFYIYKFRSMYIDAESAGPALSKTADPRITSWGKVMRKWRIDELPQFFNILKGDMSLVGPRPERKFFIDQIVVTNPEYKYLHRVKPGLTSWGMVQYGYAENVPQMIERMKYDLLYIENCSLILDIKIILYTIKVVLQGRGK